ncbi:MAG: hypothetical protein VB120_07590 [Lachnospiraceae bacterium]|nr:hypothetical protein [Lachnospiraceae bacterium]
METKRGFWEEGMAEYTDLNGKTYEVDPKTGIYSGEGGKLYKAGSSVPLDGRFIEVTEDESGNKKFIIKDKNGRIYESGVNENNENLRRSD